MMIAKAFKVCLFIVGMIFASILAYHMLKGLECPKGTKEEVRLILIYSTSLNIMQQYPVIHCVPEK